MSRTARWAVAVLPSRGCVSGAHRTAGVKTAGLNLFAVLTILMAVSKLMGMHDWSWWRVCLPVGVYVAFNLAYIGTGFIYLSRTNIEDRPSEDEPALLEEHAKTPYFWPAWVSFVFDRRDRVDGTAGSLEWLLARIRESRGHDRVWQPCGRELVLVLVEHRQLAKRVAKHKRRRNTATNNLTRRDLQRRYERIVVATLGR